MRRLVLFPPTWLKDLAGAWVFYTVLPGFPWPKPRFHRIARFAPLIGVVIGAIQASFWLGLASLGWPQSALTVFVVAINALITGGLHLDGLMDTADGVAAGPKKCLKAMKDSRAGAIGVQALMLIILIQIACLLKLNSFAPIALPIANFWGRFSSIWAINNFTYLSSNKKKSMHHSHWKGIEEFKPSLIILSITFFVF